MTPIFVHLPKTAGSSVRTLITINYGKNDVASIYGDFREVFDQCAALVGKTAAYKLIQGHIPWGTHLNLGLRNARYFFFLRHPVDRHFSDVYHGLRNPKHGFHGLLKGVESDPLALAKISDQALYFRNTATQYLSGAFFSKDVDLTDFHRAAQVVLDSEFVGLAERFNESLLIMARKLGWSQIVYEKRNVAAKPTAQLITEDMGRECEIRQPYDMALYHIAWDRFQQEAQTYGNLLQEAAQQLEEIVSQRSKAFPDLQNAEYLVGQVVTTHQPFQQAFSLDSPLGRWMNPSAAGRSSVRKTAKPRPQFAHP